MAGNPSTKTDDAPGAGRWLFLFAVLFAVPLLSFGTSWAVRRHWTGQLRTTLAGQPGMDQEKLSRISIEAVCSVPELRAELASVCGSVSVLRAMSAGALAAILLGCGLVGGILLAKRLGRGDRDRLVAWFLPGLYVMAGGLIILIFLSGILAIGAVWYGEAALLERVHIKLIAVVGIAALYGCWVMVKAVKGSLERACAAVVGKSLTREQAPKLWAFAEETAKAAGAAPPDNLVVGLEPNFFVTEADVRCLGATVRGRTLYASLPLARVLRVEEFRAVLGHEFGHFAGKDTYYSTKFYPIYRGAVESLAGLEGVKGSGVAGLVTVLPALSVLSLFLEAFAEVDNEIGRDRELEADRVAARLTSPDAVGAALVKVHALAPVWGGLDMKIDEFAREGKMLANASKTFADAAAGVAKPDILDGIDEQRLSHPTDSHPPLGARLASLGRGLASLREAALAVSPSDPAIGLFDAPEPLETELSEFLAALKSETQKPEPH